MDTTTHLSPCFAGPYFSDGPTLRGQALWESERAAHGPGHPATMLAGAWYAIGLGTHQNRDTLKLLKDAEYWMRRLGEGYSKSLGLNLAAQGFALMNLGRPGLAARRLRESIAQLDAIDYAHRSDLLRIVTSLAEAEGTLYGPVAGLLRLHAARDYLCIDRFSVLSEAAAVRAQLLESLAASEFDCERLEYVGQGKNQRYASEVTYLVKAMLEVVVTLLQGGNYSQAANAAYACAHELLENRNLSAEDITQARETLDDAFDVLDDLMRDSQHVSGDAEAVVN